jgi:eukaryotic-like serine/threonine-protein kinase
VSELFGARFVQPELIGEGGMGQVFRVKDPRLARTVALKMLQSDLPPSLAERFENEARITGRLEHPSIPPVYEYGETEDKVPYFALKLLNGLTLEEIIKKLQEGDTEAHEKYNFSERLRICLRLCEALEFAHSENLLHRDIKPENVMLGTFGEVWLLDWGIAGPPSAPDESEEPSERLTKEPTFMGTLEFAAPEQLAGTYSAASDQYSLGAVFYEFFTLEPAHKGKDRMELMTAVLQEVPKAAEKYSKPIQGRVSREVSNLLSTMLQKKPEDRFESLSEVKTELMIITGGDIQAVCPHTLAKKAMFRVGKALDNHNYWLMPLLMLWLLYPLYALCNWLIKFVVG